MRRKASSRARFMPAFDRDPREEANAFASVKQSVEANTRAGSAAGRAEFDVAVSCRLRSRAVEADGEGIERTTV